jgi:endonuclease/exonuclease/phosphatase family metal-dependent hydrolase
MLASRRCLAGPLRVLTWNLYHGRSVPPAGRELSGEFSSLLASWDWDVALLQEVPPWWPPLLASAAGAEQRAALTSRNAGRFVRRALALRWPDVIKSNGGGCNAILARGSIGTHHALRLRTWPERRVAQLARLGTGVCIANYHASARARLARLELERLTASALAWAGQAPLVLGGDLNLRSPEVAEGLIHAGSRDVDHLFAHGLEPAADAQRLDRDFVLGARRVQLSDHVPLLATLRRAA